MKICPCCTAQLEDEAQFCRNCGAIQPDAEELFAHQRPEADPYDHTAEYEEKDIANHKLFAMLTYLMDVVGVIVALLAAKESDYVQFHIRQSLKFTVVEVLLAVAAAVLFWTFITPIVAAAALVVLLVVKFIAFVHVCQGKAMEPVIIRSIGFLK